MYNQLTLLSSRNWHIINQLCCNKKQNDFRSRDKGIWWHQILDLTIIESWFIHIATLKNDSRKRRGMAKLITLLPRYQPCFWTSDDTKMKPFAWYVYYSFIHLLTHGRSSYFKALRRILWWINVAPGFPLLAGPLSREQLDTPTPHAASPPI